MSAGSTYRRRAAWRQWKRDHRVSPGLVMVTITVLIMTIGAISLLLHL